MKTLLIYMVGALLAGGLIQPKLPVARRLCVSGIIGSSCAMENYEQSLIYDSTVCLDSSFCNHEDNKSSSTEQSC